MTTRHLLLGAWVASLALGACQAPPAPVADTPKRKSFEDSAATDSAETATGGDTYQARADQTRGEWDKARQAGSDAERMRHANEALRQTQAAADAPAGSGQ
jgi:hypothetical protein